MASALLMITLYYQTKIPISFWCRRRLNPKSLIQPSKTLLTLFNRWMALFLSTFRYSTIWFYFYFFNLGILLTLKYWGCFHFYHLHFNFFFFWAFMFDSLSCWLFTFQKFILVHYVFIFCLVLYISKLLFSWSAKLKGQNKRKGPNRKLNQVFF